MSTTTPPSFATYVIGIGGTGINMFRLLNTPPCVTSTPEPMDDRSWSRPMPGMMEEEDPMYDSPRLVFFLRPQVARMEHDRDHESGYRLCDLSVVEDCPILPSSSHGHWSRLSNGTAPSTATPLQSPHADLLRAAPLWIGNTGVGKTRTLTDTILSLLKNADKNDLSSDKDMGLFIIGSLAGGSGSGIFMSIARTLKQTMFSGDDAPMLHAFGHGVCLPQGGSPAGQSRSTATGPSSDQTAYRGGERCRVPAVQQTADLKWQFLHRVGGDAIIGGGGADVFVFQGDADNGRLSTDASVNHCLIGGHGDDDLFGRDQADWMFGDTGDDTLNGNVFNDSLEGGFGNDVLYGGVGSDLFVFNSSPLEDADTIFGLSAEMDQIRIDSPVSVPWPGDLYGDHYKKHGHSGDDAGEAGGPAALSPIFCFPFKAHGQSWASKERTVPRGKRASVFLRRRNGRTVPRRPNRLFFRWPATEHLASCRGWDDRRSHTSNERGSRRGRLRPEFASFDGITPVRRIQRTSSHVGGPTSACGRVPRGGSRHA